MTIFLLLLSGCASFAPQKDFTLTILHTNDVHSHLLQIDDNDQTCTSKVAAKGHCYGGVARRYTKINEIRSQKQNILLLDAGDQFQGSMFFQKYHGEEAKIFMNKMGYNAMAAGNHEFDRGPTTLANFIKGLNFPFLSANIDVSKDPLLSKLIKPYKIIDVSGHKIGVIGFTTEETANISSPGSLLKFNNIESSVASAVSALKRHGIKIIVAVSHAGMRRDMDVASKVDGIDIIVGGHTNTFLSNRDKKAEGPYPTVVNSPSGRPVLIVTAYAYGKYLGELDVTFDALGNKKSWKGEPILLDAKVKEDKVTNSELQKLFAPIQAYEKEIIGHLNRDLVGKRSICGQSICSLGTFAANAVRKAGKPSGAAIGLFHAGAMRSDLKAGAVTRWDLMSAFPYEEPVKVISLTGADLLRALEHGVSQAHDAMGDNTGRLLQTAGLIYRFDLALPVGSRIVSIKIERNGTIKPFSMNEIYRVALPTYIANGGDGHSVLKDRSQNVKILQKTVQDAIIDYL